jgi:mannose/cellobiose epimerase-like protein (N-acyl-D-glucosamine 2-epimerase family)
MTITNKNLKNELFVSLLMQFGSVVKKDSAWDMLEWTKSNSLPRMLSLWKQLYPESYALFVRRVIEHAAR